MWLLCNHARLSTVKSVWDNMYSEVYAIFALGGGANDPAVLGRKHILVLSSLSPSFSLMFRMQHPIKTAETKTLAQYLHVRDSPCLLHTLVRRDLGVVDHVVQSPLLGFVLSSHLLLHRSKHTLPDRAIAVG